MTDDNAILEMAAKAAGLDGYIREWVNGSEFIVPGENPVVWDPLKDDGDALRLAVLLQLGISIPPVTDGRVEVVTFYGPVISIVEYPQNDDRNAAVRRAIVRAAAEIGKVMP